MGARSTVPVRQRRATNRAGRYVVHGGLKGKTSQRPIVVAADLVANVIDEIPVFAVLGTQIDGGIEVRDAARAAAQGNRPDRCRGREPAANGRWWSEEFTDGLRVERSRSEGAVVDSFGDHRIAMAFAVAGLLADGETEIEDAECVDVSFPGFFDTLASVIC